MLETGQNWELFGYDMRDLGKHWLAAWRGLLWADDSPIRIRLDDVVFLHSKSSPPALYQAGAQVAEAPFACEAVLLPEELALSRVLKLPQAVDGSLDAVIALEVNANSPFSADDTRYGWKIVSREESYLHIVLVIVSISAVMAYLAREYDLHEPSAREVWVNTAGSQVVVRGFGEDKREVRYRQRLIRCGALLALTAALVLLVAGVAAGAKRGELLQIEALATAVQREAADASAMRTLLAQANESIVGASRVIALHPSPHFEIARLTQLFDDDVHILQFTMIGRELRLRGRAKDASLVMQKLIDEPAYAEVTAPQAIVKVARSDMEQFSLNINLADGASG
jgi:general secretion pathway protein L